MPHDTPGPTLHGGGGGYGLPCWDLPEHLLHMRGVPCQHVLRLQLQWELQRMPPSNDQQCGSHHVQFRDMPGTR